MKQILSIFVLIQVYIVNSNALHITPKAGVSLSHDVGLNPSAVGVLSFENMEEIWKEVPAYEGRYQASTLGRIKSMDRTVSFKNTTSNRKGKILKLSSSRGYSTVKLYDAKFESHHLLAHRVIAKTFIPNPENKPHINHINGIKHDNRVENLEWVTHSENLLHSYATGLNSPRKGEANSFAKLTNEDVLNIRKIGHSQTYAKTGLEFNISYTVVSKIVRGLAWAHVE